MTTVIPFVGTDCKYVLVHKNTFAVVDVEHFETTDESQIPVVMAEAAFKRRNGDLSQYDIFVRVCRKQPDPRDFAGYSRSK